MLDNGTTVDYVIWTMVHHPNDWKMLGGVFRNHRLNVHIDLHNGIWCKVNDSEINATIRGWRVIKDAYIVWEQGQIEAIRDKVKKVYKEK